ncbi:MAG: branched-chain amino acid ABC transporter permease [Deltaproteobacteria bacterium]|nr:MAG: branched-chain amino acid ABC transporter permease [Deltaproteobacteria bacterium]
MNKPISPAISAARSPGLRIRPARIALGVMVIFLLFPLTKNDYWVVNLTQLMVYGIFAMSLSLVWGYGGILCFGHAVYFGMGAYIYTLIVKGMLPGFTGILGTGIMALITAISGVALFAAVIGYFLFYGRLSGPYLGIVTLAMAVIAERIAVDWYYIGGYNGLFSIPPFSIGGYQFIDPLALFYLVLSAAIAVYLLLTHVVKSPFGIILRAIRDNEPRAESFGYNSARHKIITFVIGAAVAALSGVLFAVVTEFVSPTLIGFSLSTEVLIWVALGGKEVILAAFLGALAVRALEAWLSELMAYYWLLFLGIFFVIAVIYFPRGIFGSWLADRYEHRIKGRS